MAIELTTYLTPEEYAQVKTIDLGMELDGSSDHPEIAAKAFIFRVERNLINHLTINYDFKESMIKTNKDTLNNFKLAVCDQVEWFITNGIETPTAVNEYMQQHKIFICEGAEGFLRSRGMMNIRSK